MKIPFGYKEGADFKPGQFNKKLPPTGSSVAKRPIRLGVKALPTGVNKSQLATPIAMSVSKGFRPNVFSKELWHGTDAAHWDKIRRQGFTPSIDGSRGGGVYAANYGYADMFAGRPDDWSMQNYPEAEKKKLKESRTGRGKVIAIDERNIDGWRDADGKVWQGGPISRKSGPDSPGIVHAQNQHGSSSARLGRRLDREKPITPSAWETGVRGPTLKPRRPVPHGKGVEITNLESPFDVKGVPESINRSREKRARVLDENRRKHPRASGAPGRKKAPDPRPLRGPWNEVGVPKHTFENARQTGEAHAGDRARSDAWEKGQAKKAKSQSKTQRSAYKARQTGRNHNVPKPTKAATSLKSAKPRNKKALAAVAGGTVLTTATTAAVAARASKKRKIRTEEGAKRYNKSVGDVIGKYEEWRPATAGEERQAKKRDIKRAALAAGAVTAAGTAIGGANGRRGAAAGTAIGGTVGGVVASRKLLRDLRSPNAILSSDNSRKNYPVKQRNVRHVPRVDEFSGLTGGARKKTKVTKAVDFSKRQALTQEQKNKRRTDRRYMGAAVGATASGVYGSKVVGAHRAAKVNRLFTPEAARKYGKAADAFVDSGKQVGNLTMRGHSADQRKFIASDKMHRRLTPTVGRWETTFSGASRIRNAKPTEATLKNKLVHPIKTKASADQQILTRMADNGSKRKVYRGGAFNSQDARSQGQRMSGLSSWTTERSVAEDYARRSRKMTDWERKLSGVRPRKSGSEAVVYSSNQRTGNVQPLSQLGHRERIGNNMKGSSHKQTGGYAFSDIYGEATRGGAGRGAGAGRADRQTRRDR